MGLNAIVYKNARTFASNFYTDEFEIDQKTGECVPAIEIEPRLPADFFIAFKSRLGNLSGIMLLREEIKKALVTDDSIVMGRVLYSAFHSGDMIAIDELPRLKAEIAALKAKSVAGLEEFVAVMESLILAAETEKNPIVFV